MFYNLSEGVTIDLYRYHVRQQTYFGIANGKLGVLERRAFQAEVHGASAINRAQFLAESERTGLFPVRYKLRFNFFLTSPINSANCRLRIFKLRLKRELK